MALSARPVRPAIAKKWWVLFGFVSAGLIVLCLMAGQLAPIRARPPGWLGSFSQGLNFSVGRQMLLWTLTWVFCLLLMLVFPRRLSQGTSIGLILSLGLLCRLALLPQAPGDDIYRYLWEGRLLTLGTNPYHLAPADPRLSFLAFCDPFHSLINHPHSPAIYPPLVLYLFAAIGWLHYSPMAIKVLVTAFDLAALGLVILYLGRRGLNLQWSILYGFNPVILYAFAGQGHLDALQNFFLLAALLLHDRRRYGFMFFCLGLAIQIKYVALIVLPFFLVRDNWRWIWAALIVIAIPYLFLWDEQWRLFFAALQEFGGQSAFNGSLHAFFYRALGAIAPATSVCKVVLGLALVCGYVYFHPQRDPRFYNDPLSGSFFALGALLLFSPIVHFWYLSWVVIFLPFRPKAAWFLLCLTVTLSLTASAQLPGGGPWNLHPALQALEWLPFLILLVREATLFYQRQQCTFHRETPATISVIIPALNEADWIEGCIAGVSKDPAVCEVIVVDGASLDETADKARRAGARVLANFCPTGSNGGRGGQIATGFNVAKGDVVAVVHADVRVDTLVFSRMLHLLQRQPAVIGGAVGSRFDATGWAYRILELANDLRAVATGISFGDQIQFFRRKALAACGGFPALPLMEDVELGLRLQRLGLTTYLFGTCPVSPRKWQTAGLPQVIKVLRLTGTYLWQRLWGRPDTAAMYRDYYKR
jgi:hypothetical protein